MMSDMDETLAAMYGPLATDAPHQPGATIIYEEQGHVENGAVLYAARDSEGGLLYIVSPAGAAFPTPVWETQIIAAMC